MGKSNRRRRTTYTYNAAGDRTSVTYADGVLETWSYDSTSHRITRSTDARGHSATFAYNGAYDLIDSTDAEGQRLQRTWSNGLLQTSTDARGHVTTYLYASGTRNLEPILDPEGSRTTFGHDSGGNPTTVRDPEGFLTTYLYDTLRRVTRTISPAGDVTTFGYVKGDLLTLTIDPLGKRLENVYASNGQLSVSTEYANPSGGSRQTVFYYDDAQRLRRVSDPYSGRGRDRPCGRPPAQIRICAGGWG